jgi:proteasome lid subunit RPN8/RPN11
MIEHCVAAAPLEACGLLAADAQGLAARAYCLSNTDASPVSYTLDPSEHIAALHDAEADGLRLAAVFHSHPAGPPLPSATDVRLALEPEWLYLIVGLAGPEPAVRGFEIVGGVVAEVPLLVKEAA